jgi:hypothetical protein
MSLWSESTRKGGGYITLRIEFDLNCVFGRIKCDVPAWTGGNKMAGVAVGDVNDQSRTIPNKGFSYVSQSIKFNF